MSQFSGKCDFYDSVVMIHCDDDPEKLEDFLAGTNIYIYGKDGRNHKIEVRNEKEACLYYPYLTVVAAFNCDENKNTIILSSNSFIDKEEREHIGYYINDVRKYWNKCKRNKEEFTVEKCVEHFSMWRNTELYQEIATRFLNNGNKAEFDDIHDNMHEYYRRKWFDELVRLGYTEYEAYSWCFKGRFDDDDTIIERLGRPINVGEVQPG